MHIDFPRRGRSGWTRFVPSWRQLLSLAGLGFFLMVAAFVILYISIDVPAPNQLATANATIVYYSDGKHAIGTFAAVDRQSVPLSEVPVDVQHAVMAAEDRSFYQNQGVSPKGIGRAIWNDLLGRPVQGGSTITQQYVKNAYLSQERTLKRKIDEFIVALKIDHALSKDQILEDYLNTIYFGRGAYGIQAASQAYFGVDSKNLTLDQGAALAAIIRSPGNYDPAAGKQEAAALKARFTYVIDGMVSSGWLSSADAAKAKVPHVRPPSGNALRGQRGYLLETVRQEMLAHGFTDQQLSTGGYRITTTFDRTDEAAAVAAVKDNFPTINAKGVQAGLASVQPGTGRIVALYGGKNYLKRQLSSATQAHFPAGSTFKAFTLGAAFENGVSLTDTFNGNSPFTVPGSPPVNNEFDQSYGTVSLLTATEQSINTAFVDLTLQIGASKVLDSAERAGIPANTPGLNNDARVTLGTSSVTPLEMADAYATFAAQGKQADAYCVERVKGSNGAVVYQAHPKTSVAYQAPTAAEVTYALTQVIAHGTGTNALALGRPAAGKTGTAEDKTSWFVGYTPQLSTAVGFYRGQKRQLSLNGVGGLSTFFGGEYPTKIWTEYMKAALAGQPVQQFPVPPAPVATATPTPSKTPTPTATSASPSPTHSSTSPSPSPSPTPTSSGSPSPSSSTSGSGPPSPSSVPH